jgi:hypothetical protein
LPRSLTAPGRTTSSGSAPTPLESDGITQTAWLPRYERELAAGHPGAALVTIMKGTADRTAFRLVPRFLLASAVGHVMRATEGRAVPAGVVSPGVAVKAPMGAARAGLPRRGGRTGAPGRERYRPAPGCHPCCGRPAIRAAAYAWSGCAIGRGRPMADMATSMASCTVRGSATALS